MQAENILFILTDQWPSGAFSFMGADIPTPGIDRLAARGTVFTNAFTSCPLCTPARGALLTARWPHQTRVYDNYAVGHSQQEPLSIDEPTWIEEAVQQKYHVGYHGKWHLGPNNPEARGAHCFDRQVDAPRASQSGLRKRPFSYDLVKERYAERGRRQLMRGRAPFWGEVKTAKEGTAPFSTMASGVRFLEDWVARGKTKPFFLTVSSAPPHFPHYLPEENARIADGLRGKVELPVSLEDDCAGRPWFHSSPWWPCMDTSVLDRDEWRTVVAYSHAHIMMVDEAIGRILDALDSLGLSECTTIIFTSDHGDMGGAHNRFDKGPYFYEEVWRIPLIVCRPGVPAATQNGFVSILDLGETLYRLAGATSSDSHPRAGRNLLPLVGSSDLPAEWPNVAYGVYDLYNGISFVVRAVRDERWKYVWNPQDMDELYDLVEDPHEMRNLAGDPAAADAQTRLRQLLLAWLEDIGDDLPDRIESLPFAGTVMSTGKPGP